MNLGTPARLIDDRSELKREWFSGVETLLVTAGASAPEDLVHDLIEELVRTYGAEVEQHDVRREEVEFGLPGSLRSLMRERGLDPEGRRIVRGDEGSRLREWFSSHHIPFRIVDLTVQGAAVAP
jgi:4-hydroxy-3-methylbut-2-enyl diphosphate reductase